jgi:hypothetical protein
MVNGRLGPPQALPASKPGEVAAERKKGSLVKHLQFGRRALIAAVCSVVGLAGCGAKQTGEKTYRTAMPIACLTAPQGGSAGPRQLTADLTREEALDQGRVGWEIKGVIPLTEPVSAKNGGGICVHAAFVLMQREVSAGQ